MLSQLWQALEQIPGQEAAMCEWRIYLGDHIALISHLLIPTDRFATAVPVAGDPYAHYRVVRHAANDVVGVNSRGGPPVALLEKDVLIYRLAVGRLVCRLCDATGIDYGYGPAEGIPHTYRIGSFRPVAGFSYPAFLTIPLESIDLHRAVQAIAANYGDPFIISAPTRGRLRPPCEAILSSKKACFLALNEAIETDRNGAWIARASAQRQLSLFQQSALPEATKTSPAVFFPTPPDAAWSDLKIKFRDRQTVTSKVGDVSRVLTYLEMGMADARDKSPTKQWELLYSFAEGFGQLTWASPAATRKNQKRREDLTRNLQAFFRIDGDPIVYDSDSRGWRTLFQLEP